MRAAGLDVAALTDHATLSDNLLGDVVQGLLPPEYTQLGGLTPQGWRRTGELADAADRDGRFTAIRGFEWSEPALGHVNVWFSRSYVDVLQAGTMQPFYEWLLRDPDLADLDLVDSGLVDGGADGRSSPLCACLNAGWRTGLSGVTDEHGTDWGFPECSSSPAAPVAWVAPRRSPEAGRPSVWTSIVVGHGAASGWPCRCSVRSSQRHAGTRGASVQRLRSRLHLAVVAGPRLTGGSQPGAQGL